MAADCFVAALNSMSPVRDMLGGLGEKFEGIEYRPRV